MAANMDRLRERAKDEYCACGNAAETFTYDGHAARFACLDCWRAEWDAGREARKGAMARALAR